MDRPKLQVGPCLLLKCPWPSLQCSVRQVICSMGLVDERSIHIWPNVLLTFHATQSVISSDRQDGRQTVLLRILKHTIFIILGIIIVIFPGMILMISITMIVMLIRVTVCGFFRTLEGEGFINTLSSSLSLSSSS